MAQRLVLSTRNDLTLADLIRFGKEASEDYQIPPKTPLKVTADSGDGEGTYYSFSVMVPDALRKRTVKVKKRKTKKEEKIEAAVAEQIESHKQDVKEGKNVAHVPPVKGTVKKKPKKKRAPKLQTVEEMAAEGTTPQEQMAEVAQNIAETPEQIVETALNKSHERRPAKKSSKKKDKKNTTAFKGEKETEK